jgi:hypothetical protein
MDETKQVKESVLAKISYSGARAEEACSEKPLRTCLPACKPLHKKVVFMGRPRSMNFMHARPITLFVLVFGTARKATTNYAIQRYRVHPSRLIAAET